MKIWKCLTLRKEGLPQDVLNEVVQCYPPFSEGKGFRHSSRLECQPGDIQAADDVGRLLRILEKHGLPRSQGWAPGSYNYEAERVYEAQDLLEAELLLVDIHSNEIQIEHARDAADRLILLAGKLKRNFVAGRIYPNHLIVSDGAMKLIASAGIVGSDFKELAAPKSTAAALSQGAWEVTSSKVLPRIANVDQFLTVDKSGLLPFRGDYSKPIGILEPPYRSGGEVHYRRSDIESCEKFDIATTYENYLFDHQALVISQRFYQFCLKNKIPLDVKPIRIDD